MKFEDSDRCVMLMSIATREMTAGPDRRLAQHGLGRHHHRALFTIRRQAGVSVGDLGRELKVTKQAVQKTLKPLLSDGFVRIESGQDDARMRCLFLTKRGEELEGYITGMQREVFTRVERRVGRKTLDTWQKAVRAIIAEAALISAEEW
jgi:DNA-binding MarR family transcriptional regulator